MPRVSVLMSVLNGERYLREAIESILTQTHRDLELIVVDDGSSDETPRILASIDHPRLIVLTNPQRVGVGKSMQAALLRAGGSLIARMDADDVSYPHRIERSLQILDRYPSVAMVAASADRLLVDQGITLPNFYASAYGFVDVHPSLDDHVAHVRRLLAKENVVCQPTVTMRRSIIEQVGFYRLPVVEDYDLWLRIAESFPIVILPEPWLLHRVHGESTSNVRPYEMRRYEWVVRTAAARRRAGRPERLEFLKWWSRVGPVAPVIAGRTASDRLRLKGRALIDGGHPAAGFLQLGLGYVLATISKPGMGARATAQHMARIASKVRGARTSQSKRV